MPDRTDIPSPESAKAMIQTHSPASIRKRFLSFAGSGLLGLGMMAFTLLQSPPQTQAQDFDVQVLTTELKRPWGLAFLPDGDMLVTERNGTLALVSPDGTVNRLDGVAPVAPDGQGGLLDIALSPDFARDQRLYFSYSRPFSNGESGTALATAVLDRTGQAITDWTNLFTINRPTDSGRHFGSRLVMRGDGTLFMTVGDRADRDRAQDPNDHAGSILRLNLDGSVPEDNPFVGQDGYQPEIWSIGHRNPQGAALHPETGELWTVEHGARGGDEINKPEAGRNYGWPVISYGRHYSYLPIGEGTHKEGLEQPRYYWDPSIAPSGLSFYHGDLFPQWKGSLFVGALKDQKLIRLNLDGDEIIGEQIYLEKQYGRIRDVRQGPDGALWLLTDSSKGRLLRLVPKD
ncbi:PQQ-dependent sugar dehydrogenase [Kiloniella sp. b19]|uniref:PQQ-dependent sugar dehydrogenase n=1 Tax=Kiloniella sp. GXU_MW_B19 TaxID=3141326 RepID=UPI0031CDC2CB